MKVIKQVPKDNERKEGVRMIISRCITYKKSENKKKWTKILVYEIWNLEKLLTISKDYWNKNLKYIKW